MKLPPVVRMIVVAGVWLILLFALALTQTGESKTLWVLVVTAGPPIAFWICFRGLLHPRAVMVICALLALLPAIYHFTYLLPPFYEFNWLVVGTLSALLSMALLTKSVYNSARISRWMLCSIGFLWWAAWSMMVLPETTERHGNCTDGMCMSNLKEIGLARARCSESTRHLSPDIQELVKGGFLRDDASTCPYGTPYAEVMNPKDGGLVVLCHRHHPDTLVLKTNGMVDRYRPVRPLKFGPRLWGQ